MYSAGFAKSERLPGRAGLRGGTLAQYGAIAAMRLASFALGVAARALAWRRR